MKNILLLILLLASFNVSALSVTVSWVAPTHREDNTLIAKSEIAGYNVYYTDTKTGDYQQSVFVSGGATLKTIDIPGAFKYFIVVTAVDTDGRESGYSNEVSKTFVKPSMPTFNIGRLDPANIRDSVKLSWN